MERHCWANAQYSRQKCLDATDIPSEVDADVLKEKILNIFCKLGFDIPPEQTEDYHRIIKKSSTAIVKFTKRIDCQQVWSVKKELQKTKMEDANLPRQNKLFINKNLFHSTKYCGPRAIRYKV